MEKIGRKIWHLSGLLLAAFYALMGRETGLVALGLLLVLLIVFDVMRFKLPGFNQFIYAHFGRFIRDNERGRLNGSTWYALGVLVAAALYDLPILAFSVAFLAVGDVSATTVGERWGSIKLWGGRSLQGTLAFVVAGTCAGLVISAFFYPLPVWMILVGAVCAAVVELCPFGLNDNLTIPVISGGLLKLLFMFVI